jgi:hypothetical protein
LAPDKLLIINYFGYDIPFDKVITINATGKYKALKGCIVIIRDVNDLRQEEKELKVNLPDELIGRNILIVSYNYDIDKVKGGFTTGRDEIDVQRMEFKRTSTRTDVINVYKIKRSLYYR